MGKQFQTVGRVMGPSRPALGFPQFPHAKAWKGPKSSGSIRSETDSMQGRVIDGRYRLTEKLGQGGMGSVWRAEHLALRSQVAVKLTCPTVAESPDALVRFEREALAVAELRSTHIVQVIDYGIDEGTPFIVMELLIGENLGARIRRQGRLSLLETTQILVQVARALSVAHNRGIVHRDLKPDNIFITSESDEALVKVLDFGVAKRVDTLSGSTGLQTHAGVLLGTPYYMSPEQALGEPGIDSRSDIWALGIIAYECVTGRLPFDKGTLGALLMSICHDDPPMPSRIVEVPVAFDDWFAQATARDKTQRFSSATEAASMLSAISGWELERSRSSLPGQSSPPVASTTTVLSNVSTQSVRPASVTNHNHPEKRVWRWVAALASAAIVLTVATVFVANSNSRVRTATARPASTELRAAGSTETETVGSLVAAGPAVLPLASATAAASAESPRVQVGRQPNQIAAPVASVSRKPPATSRATVHAGGRPATNNENFAGF